jgi:MFS family permease
MHQKLTFFTLSLLISFASVNAVLFTPALPNIAHFFNIDENTTQQTITLFLIGYALGQLIYGPLANRFGRKNAIYMGIVLQIISSFLCVFAGTTRTYTLLIVARFMLALGAGVGLKMTFTLVNEYYKPNIASRMIAYLLVAFAITPALSVALGGLLTAHYGWTSCFYAGAMYGLILLFFVSRLPETQSTRDLDALKIKPLLRHYAQQFKHQQLIVGGLLMGCASCFVYVFTTITPFVAINLLGLSSTKYGFANTIPPIGLVFGSIVNAKLSRHYGLLSIIRIGIIITSIGTVSMLIAISMKLSALMSLFVPMVMIYFGSCLMLANASTIAMRHTHDKAHGSAVMNFINMGLTTMLVLSLSSYTITLSLLPNIYLILCVVSFGILQFINEKQTTE